jgi:hypothetical protein
MEDRSMKSRLITWSLVLLLASLPAAGQVRFIGSPGGTDHGSLGGLTDDDHTQYLLAAGTRALSANWDAGSYKIIAETFESDVVIGTAPFTVASTTVVTNLNADTVDGESASAFQDASANLDTYAGIAPSANVQTLLGAANYAAFKTSLSLNNVENVALSAWAGSGNITTLGSISTCPGFTSAGTIQGATLTDGTISINGGSVTGTWVDLGTITTCDIDGGTINGITDLAVADGGTGASTAAAARTALSVSSNVQRLAFHWSNGASPVDTSEIARNQIPVAGTLTGYDLICDQSATVTIDVWADARGTAPDNSDSITDSHEPATSAAVSAYDDDIADWSDVTMTAKQFIYANVDANDNATSITLYLYFAETH